MGGRAHIRSPAAVTAEGGNLPRVSPEISSFFVRGNRGWHGFPAAVASDDGPVTAPETQLSGGGSSGANASPCTGRRRHDMQRAQHVETTAAQATDRAFRSGSVGFRSRIRAVFHEGWCGSVRRDRVGAAGGRHRERAWRGRVRAARRRVSEVLVAAGDQHRRVEVLPRPDRHAAARAVGQAADRPRRRHDHDVGARAGVLRVGGRPAGVQRRAEAPARVPEGVVQQPGLVQLRVREGARSARPASSTRCRTRWSRS